MEQEQERLLVVVLGDSPRLPTGLGRIARDLAGHLHERREALGIEVVQIGWEYEGGGASYWPPLPWPVITFPEIGQDWGARKVLQIVTEVQNARQFDDAHVVLLTIWDPARCFEYRELPWQKWGYFAIDGHNPHGSFGGPAAEAVQKYDRVLAYGWYGAEVLKTVVKREVEFLPHGHWITPERVDAAWQRFGAAPDKGWRFGCVASNTPRKDLGLFFHTLSVLRTMPGGPVYAWLHVDELVTSAWSVPELIEVYGIKRSWLELTHGTIAEEELLARYASCAATLAVGRGEGFGYPIVESLACGRGVAHVDYAGGAELIPRQEWRIPLEGFDYTNPYVIGRPFVDTPQCVGRLMEIATEALAGADLEHFCQASVAHLHWSQLWPRWESWMRHGLTEYRRAL